jgi:hypothetical protein
MNYDENEDENELNDGLDDCDYPSRPYSYGCYPPYQSPYGNAQESFNNKLLSALLASHKRETELLKKLQQNQEDSLLKEIAIQQHVAELKKQNEALTTQLQRRS